MLYIQHSKYLVVCRDKALSGLKSLVYHDLLTDLQLHYSSAIFLRRQEQQLGKSTRHHTVSSKYPDPVSYMLQEILTTMPLEEYQKLKSVYD